MAERLLTVAETAQRLATTAQGLRWMMHKGTAPKSAKIGGRRVFRETDVDSFIASAFADVE